MTLLERIQMRAITAISLSFKMIKREILWVKDLLAWDRSDRLRWEETHNWITKLIHSPLLRPWSKIWLPVFSNKLTLRRLKIQIPQMILLQINHNQLTNNYWILNSLHSGLAFSVKMFSKSTSVELSKQRRLRKKHRKITRAEITLMLSLFCKKR